MGTLDLGRQTTDGIARAVIRVGRGCANGSYGHTGISADKSVRASCRWDSGCANGSHGSMVGSAIMRRYYCMSSLDSGRITTDGIARAAFGRAGNARMVHMGILESAPMES